MGTTTGAAPKRVMLHVGAPKSGTTFLQRALWRHRDELLAQGVVCAGERQQDMFHAAIEVRETFDVWGYERERLVGTWSRLCAGARAFDGTTIMSHEVLSAARPRQVKRALAELEGLEVHVVVTARDLARQVTSEWQERIKNGKTFSFAQFSGAIEEELSRGDLTGSFWRYQHVVGMLDRWAAEVPPERVHVVVAPPPGGAPDVLWLRFADAIGFDGGRIDPTAVEETANQTLGAVQVSVLRRLNEALDGRIPQPHYARIVKRQFAQKTLAAQRSRKPTCPADLSVRLREVSEAQNAEILARGYQVHGDLDELVPPMPTSDDVLPDAVAADDEAATAIQALADVLVERYERGAGRQGSGEWAPDDTADRGSVRHRIAARLRRGASRER